MHPAGSGDTKAIAPVVRSTPFAAKPVDQTSTTGKSSGYVGRDYLQIAFNVCPVALLVARASDGKIVDANPACEAILGSSREDLLSRGLDEVFEGDALACCLRASCTKGQPVSVSMQPAKDSAMIPVSVYRCGAGGAELILLALESRSTVTAPTREAPPIETDPLTGLAMRTNFDERLVEALERVRRQGPPYFAVMFLDLDSFKLVNDQFGHAMGDRVLAALARRLAAGIRPGDVLSRRGGDEFTLLVENVLDASEALGIAERLRKHAMGPLEVDGHVLQVGISIGVVMGDGSMDSAEAIIDAADRAMYAAKRVGRPMLHPCT